MSLTFNDVARICADFERSGRELLRVCQEFVACDDIRIGMVEHLYPDLEKCLAWHDGAMTLMNSKGYRHGEMREQLLRDMDARAQETLRVAAEIERILGPLGPIVKDVTPMSAEERADLDEVFRKLDELN